MRYSEALAWFYGRQRFGIKLGLDNIARILEYLERPQDAFRALHVTGTNGKGSTCAYLESCLRAAGHRVGLYTSPHLVSFRERILIGGQPVAPEQIGKAADRVRSAVERLETARTHPTFFECVTALAFELFRSQRVAWGVLEVGLGGRLDATNVCNPIATVITNVGLEHTEQLGSSVQSIAREKSGILKPGVPLITGARGPALDAIAKEATTRKVPIRVLRAPDPVEETLAGTRFQTLFAGERIPFETSLLGRHQAHNAALALAALESGAKDVSVPPDAAQRGLKTTLWPGRLEITSRDPLTLLDGAHNAPAMEELAGFLDRHASHRRIAVVLGILRDKNARGMLSALAPRVARIVLTNVPNERTLSPEELRQLLPTDAPAVEVEPDVTEAFRRGLAHGEEPVRLITGSLFLVGEARAQLLKLERDPPVAVPIAQ